ncbi:hypothetical protein [Streptomyces sp. NPDC051677]|uniref:hypothetical protein n=1 Tax=Streptomyces sp. NPDC051677 TaxID=3365669 RepID=UPI0037CF642D
MGTCASAWRAPKPPWHELGRLEFEGHATAQDAVRRKVGQLREAQDAGLLDPAWDPTDIIVLLNQIAMAWAGRLDLVDAAADQVRDPSPAARRAAVVAAVQRLSPPPPATPAWAPPAAAERCRPAFPPGVCPAGAGRVRDASWIPCAKEWTPGLVRADRGRHERSPHGTCRSCRIHR